jgi:hypothetical protein
MADEALEPDLVTLERAAYELYGMFGALLDADYIQGKTIFRDALADRFELSQCVAEYLCDELERAERIRFVRTAEGAGWHIHVEGGARP